MSILWIALDIIICTKGHIELTMLQSKIAYNQTLMVIKNVHNYQDYLIQLQTKIKEFGNVYKYSYI